MRIHCIHHRWLLALVLFVNAGTSIAEPRGRIQVERAGTELSNGIYFLSANLDIVLGRPPLEAMENGLPLTIVVEMEILRTRRAMWDKRIAELESRYRIHTHSLSNRFVIQNVASGESKSYSSLRQMLRALGQIRDFPLLDATLLDPESRYTARLRAKLDIESLPAPLRPTAYLSPSWHISSDWYEWPIER